MIKRIFSLKSIKNRLILIFLLCSFMPLLLLRFMAFPKAQKDLEEALIRNLEGVKQKQAEIVKMWFNERRHDAKVVSRNISDIVGKSIRDKDTNFIKLKNYIEMLRTEYGYKGVSITSRDGIVLVATESELVGSNLMGFDYCREALNGNVFASRIQCFARIENGKKKCDSEYPSMFFSAPVIDSDNLTLGAVILRVDTASLSEIM